MPKESAVEILVFKPNSAIPIDQRGVHENLWLKQRFKQFVSIGVYLDNSDLKYYFFNHGDSAPKIYTSLAALKQDLPKGLETIFDNTPLLFIMGHGRGDQYGLGNHPVEIYNADFDKIITDFEKTLPVQHDEIVVTLEACNTDNCEQAAKGKQDKTFLEQLSAKHPHMTFSGTGPWDPKDPQTGYRASGGFPILNVPIAAMSGGIWRHGESVIFYHDNYQLIVKKSLFASTDTAKELKINTVKYAREVLKKSCLDHRAIHEIITKISSNRAILKIEDLKKFPNFPQEKFADSAITKLLAEENRIVEKGKNNYITRVQNILDRVKCGEKFTDRDLLIIILGLKDLSIFNGHEDLRNEILVNKVLLSLLMVTCGKVLIAGPKNDPIIDLLLTKGIDINSVDEKGMTALHYAVQNFYNYREEPLNLIRKLLACGANLKSENNDRRSPLALSKDHCGKSTVIAGAKLQELLEQKQEQKVYVNSDNLLRGEANASVAKLLTGYNSLFRKSGAEHILGAQQQSTISNEDSITESAEGGSWYAPQ